MEKLRESVKMTGIRGWLVERKTDGMYLFEKFVGDDESSNEDHYQFTLIEKNGFLRIFTKVVEVDCKEKQRVEDNHQFVYEINEIINCYNQNAA